MPTNICTKCKEEKNLLEFNKDARTSDGLTRWCRQCYREYNANRHANLTKEDIDRINVQRGVWRKLNPDKVKEQGRRSRSNLTREDKDRRNELSREWHKLHPGYAEQQRDKTKSKPDYKEKIREKNLRDNFGLTIQQYDEMDEQQGHRCAICKSVNLSNKAIKHWHIDHCHKTGIVRGLLCDKCNRGLGLFRDNPQILKSVIKYLSQS